MEKVESVISRMRWKVHFFLNQSNNREKYHYGLNSKKSPPLIPQMKNFEEDVVRMIETLNFAQ